MFHRADEVRGVTVLDSLEGRRNVVRVAHSGNRVAVLARRRQLLFWRGVVPARTEDDDALDLTVAESAEALSDRAHDLVVRGVPEGSHRGTDDRTDTRGIGHGIGRREVVPKQQAEFEQTEYECEQGRANEGELDQDDAAVGTTPSPRLHQHHHHHHLQFEGVVVVVVVGGAVVVVVVVVGGVVVVVGGVVVVVVVVVGGVVVVVVVGGVVVVVVVGGVVVVVVPGPAVPSMTSGANVLNW